MYNRNCQDIIKQEKTLLFHNNYKDYLKLSPLRDDMMTNISCICRTNNKCIVFVFSFFFYQIITYKEPQRKFVISKYATIITLQCKNVQK